MEQVKSQICDNVALYAQKYDEEFSPHLPGFVTAIWNLLVSTGQEVKYDLVSLGILVHYYAYQYEKNTWKSVLLLIAIVTSLENI